jgi:hypothetical protein
VAHAESPAPVLPLPRPGARGVVGEDQPEAGAESGAGPKVAVPARRRWDSELDVATTSTSGYWPAFQNPAFQLCQEVLTFKMHQQRWRPPPQEGSGPQSFGISWCSAGASRGAQINLSHRKTELLRLAAARRATELEQKRACKSSCSACLQQLPAIVACRRVGSGAAPAGPSLS